MTSANTTLRSSKQYIWNVSDVLGTGATGAVYKGRNKKTGDVVAVKTFNHISFMRPYEVQMREFEVLLKLNHKNIVKLHDIEEEGSSRQNVIVMELCTGSLYTMLDEPENAYGLSEIEFKQVLKDVAAGMNHLKDKNIVHRDLKPGNIMRVRGDEGQSIYKLADFGAARELDDNQQFMSLYGTEEYLHPDLYERAVLRKPMGKTFSASVDLWSIGVTLFHVAAGHLPFRPFGGRRNRETMYYITTQKASGVISGVQKRDDGDIEWSRELPKTSQLSQGLKDLVTPVLAGLMECDQDRMWTFEQFISETDRILSMKVIDVFNVTTAKLHKIYIEPNQTYAEYQDLIAAQTETSAGSQELYFDYESFCPDPLDRCIPYPNTTEENPMFMFRRDVSEFPNAMPPPIPKIPKVTTSYSLESDAPLAKMTAAVMFYVQRTMLYVMLLQNLMKKSRNIYQTIVKQELASVRFFHMELKTVVNKVTSSMEQMRDMTTNKSLEVMCKCVGKEGKDIERELGQSKDDVIKELVNSVEMSQKFDDVQNDIDGLYCEIITDDKLSSSAADLLVVGCQSKDRCLSKLDVLVDTVSVTAAQFKKDKALKRLSYNEEQIHKFEKQKMNTNCVRGVSLYQDHCEPNLRNVHRHMSTWFKDAKKYRTRMTQIDGEISALNEQYEVFEEQNLKEIVSRTKQKINKISDDLERLLKLQTEKHSLSSAGGLGMIIGTVGTVGAVNGTTGAVAMMNGHDTGLPKSPNQVLVPKVLKEEMKMWKTQMVNMNRDIEQNSDLIKLYKNILDEKGKGADKDFDFDEEK